MRCPSKLVQPETSAADILVQAAVKGLFHLPAFDLSGIYNLWNVKQDYRSTIPLSWFKDSVIMLQVNKGQEQDMRSMIDFCEDGGWVSKCVDKPYESGHVAFVWKSLDNFLKDGADDKEEDVGTSEQNDNKGSKNDESMGTESEDDESKKGGTSSDNEGQSGEVVSMGGNDDNRSQKNVGKKGSESASSEDEGDTDSDSESDEGQEKCSSKDSGVEEQESSEDHNEEHVGVEGQESLNEVDDERSMKRKRAESSDENESGKNQVLTTPRRRSARKTGKGK